MRTVYQTVIDAEIGNCHQAIIASILELNITQVPNFILYGDDDWFKIYYSFLYAHGWQYTDVAYPEKRDLRAQDSINGYFDTTVKSKSFPGKKHAVVMDLEGIVVHDPNPNKKFLGVDLIETGQLLNWMMFTPVGVK